jgi:hypothetical protein
VKVAVERSPGRGWQHCLRHAPASTALAGAEATRAGGSPPASWLGAAAGG